MNSDFKTKASTQSLTWRPLASKRSMFMVDDFNKSYTIKSMRTYIIFISVTIKSCLI